MASVAFTLVTQDGLQTSSFTMDEVQAKRLFEAYKYLFMSLDQQDIDFQHPEEATVAPPEVNEADYTPKTVFDRLAGEFMVSIANRVHEVEMNRAINALDIQPLDYKV